MTSFTGVFERKEVKYRLNVCQQSALMRQLEGRLVPDVFGRTHILSWYLDTPERLLIERSLDKPRYKEKIRVRSYGLPTDESRVFVEIKKKYKGIVYKRRVGCSYAAARAYVAGMPYEQACERYPLPDAGMAAESLAPQSVQIAREIDWCMARYGELLPSMVTSCDRTAYVSGEPQAASEPVPSCPSDQVRITFDAALRYRDLFQKSGVELPLLGAHEVIMEIKSAGPFPLWLVRALDACQAYPTSFSKYGEAYRVCATNDKTSLQKGGRCA